MPQPPRSACFIPRHRFEHIADPGPDGGSVMNEAVLNKLEKRLGRLHAKLRLGIETDHEAQIFGQGIIIFTLRSLHSPGERLADARLRLRAIEAPRAPAARPP